MVRPGVIRPPPRREFRRSTPSPFRHSVCLEEAVHVRTSQTWALVLLGMLTQWPAESLAEGPRLLVPTPVGADAVDFDTRIGLVVHDLEQAVWAAECADARCRSRVIQAALGDVLLKHRVELGKLSAQDQLVVRAEILKAKKRLFDGWREPRVSPGPEIVPSAWATAPWGPGAIAESWRGGVEVWLSAADRKAESISPLVALPTALATGTVRGAGDTVGTVYTLATDAGARDEVVTALADGTVFTLPAMAVAAGEAAATNCAASAAGCVGAARKAQKFHPARALPTLVQSLRKSVKRFCFVAGTQVQTPSGPQPIETLQVGDLVYARKSAGGRTVARPIVQTFITQDKEILALRLKHEDMEEEVRVTLDHPFHRPGHGWVGASELEAGFTLTGLDGPITVTLVERLYEKATVYNFMVEGRLDEQGREDRDEYHNYFVSHLGVWVHNETNPCPFGKARRRGVDPDELDERRRRKLGEWMEMDEADWPDELKRLQRKRAKTNSRVRSTNGQESRNAMVEAGELLEDEQLLERLISTPPRPVKVAGAPGQRAGQGRTTDPQGAKRPFYRNPKLALSAVVFGVAAWQGLSRWDEFFPDGVFEEEGFYLDGDILKHGNRLYLRGEAEFDEEAGIMTNKYFRRVGERSLAHALTARCGPGVRSDQMDEPKEQALNELLYDGDTSNKRCEFEWHHTSSDRPLELADDAVVLLVPGFSGGWDQQPLKEHHKKLIAALTKAENAKVVNMGRR